MEHITTDDLVFIARLIECKVDALNRSINSLCNDASNKSGNCISFEYSDYVLLINLYGERDIYLLVLERICSTLYKRGIVYGRDI